MKQAIPPHPLRNWRKAKGFTLEHCAAAVGTSRPVWHAWETGKRRPDAIFMPRVREFTEGAVGADAFFPSLDGGSLDGGADGAGFEVAA